MCGYNFLADGKSKAGSVFLMCDKKVKESRQILGGIPQPVSCTRMVRKSPSKQREILIVPPEGIASAAFSDQVQKKADEIAWYQGQSAEWQIP